jgi:hypothetical protein
MVFKKERKGESVHVCVNPDCKTRVPVTETEADEMNA